MAKKYNIRYIYISLILLTITLVVYFLPKDAIATQKACSQSIQMQDATFSSIKESTNKLSGMVVYTAAVQDIWQIFIKNLDNGDVRQLTNSSNGYSHAAKWSPDGSQIIFLRYTKENLDDIYIMDKNGENQAPLVATKVDESDARWSPDGTKIAFTSTQTGSSQIYVMDVKSKSITQLTNAFTYAAFPAWSSDGKRIAFQSADGGEAGRTQIFIINADGTNLMQMTDYNVYTFDGQPVWCPDDSCLVFSRDAGGGAKLMFLDIASKTVTPLFADIFGADTMQTSLDRSPSRCYFTFLVDNKYFAFDIYNKKLYPLDLVRALSVSLYP